MRLIRDRRAYSLTWWAAFFTFLLLPLLSLSIGIGRYAIAAAEVQEAADLAALAAVRDVDLRLFEASGVIRFLAGVPYGRAAAYASMNTHYLPAQGIRVRVTAIWASDADRTVRVRCAADLSPLFPQLFPNVVVEREGIAQVRMRAESP